jgi:phosphoribosyl 1,2-cyclic phosphate phosphodiesterase
VNLDDAAFETLQGVDTWLVGCFQRAPHLTHAHVDRVIAWSERVGARRTILTHMGPDLDWDWMARKLPAGIEPAFDGLMLEFAS